MIVKVASRVKQAFFSSWLKLDMKAHANKRNKKQRNEVAKVLNASEKYLHEIEDTSTGFIDQHEMTMLHEELVDTVKNLKSKLNTD